MDFADSPWLWDSGTPRPTFERDFARDKELDRGGTGPAITFERPSGATYFNVDGVLVGVDFSATSNTIGTGSKTFTLDATAGISRSWTVGSIVRVSQQGASANFMRGTVTSYDAATQVLVMDATTTGGSGTITSWRLGTEEPRFDHSQDGAASSLGLLIEESRTNSLRNSQAGGSTNGVIGSGGVVPTHWVVTAQTGISREIIGTGTVNGMAYIDMRFSGTATAGSFTAIQFEASGQISALQNQTWTTSVSVALVAGTLANVSNTGIGFAERDSEVVAVVSGVTTSFTPSATMVRHTGTRTLTNASTAFYASSIRFVADSGQAVDFTLRIAAPQLEQGAFATSYIPTTTTAVTRSADVATVSPISSFYSATESTMLAEFEVRGPLPSARYVQLDDETNSNRIVLGLTSGASVQNFTAVANVTSLSSSIADALVTDTIYKIGAAFAANDAISARNGTLAGPDSTGSVPSGIVRLSLSGQPPSANTRQGLWLRRFAYWPTRLSDTLLQQLTA